MQLQDNIQIDLKQITELEYLLKDTAIYIYKSLEGLVINSTDIARGSYTTIIQDRIDYADIKEPPYVGEKLFGYVLNDSETDVIRVESDWQVIHVEAFKPEIPGIVSQVFVAWCNRIIE